MPTPAPADLDVVVLGGAGHVGLPLSLVLADSGARVGIFDIDGPRLERLMAGEMPFMEHGAEGLLIRVLETGRLEFGTEPAMVARTDVVIVVIGTPVDEFLGPSMTVFERSVDDPSAARRLVLGAAAQRVGLLDPRASERRRLVRVQTGRQRERLDLRQHARRVAEPQHLELVHHQPLDEVVDRHVRGAVPQRQRQRRFGGALPAPH